MLRLKPIALALCAAAVLPLPAMAGEIDDLKKTLKQLVQRIDELEKEQQSAKTAIAQVKAAPVTTSAATSASANSVAPVDQSPADLPNSFRIPGSDTSIRFYGYAQMDGTYDVKGRNRDTDNYDWASYIAAQPLDNSSDGKRGHQLYMTARTSRFGLETSTPTDTGPLHVKIEGDFNSPNVYSGESLTNSMVFRLRHAYGTLGNVLAGQTWSNFSDLGSYGDSVDFNGSGDVTFVRQPQVRYTLPLGKATSLAMAIENPQSRDVGNTNFDSTPDATFNLTTQGHWGHASVRAVAQQYRNDEHSKYSFGFGAGGSLKFGNDTLVAQVNGGSGIGRYMLNSFAQGAYDNGQEIMFWDALGGHIGYTHVWSPKVRSNVILARTVFSGNDTLEALTDSSGNRYNHAINEAMINTFWSVAKNTEAGIEYAYGQRKTFDGETGTQNRINATLRYNLF